jgi:hypothetical protein
MVASLPDQYGSRSPLPLSGFAVIAGFPSCKQQASCEWNPSTRCLHTLAPLRRRRIASCLILTAYPCAAPRARGYMYPTCCTLRQREPPFTSYGVLSRQYYRLQYL